MCINDWRAGRLIRTEMTAHNIGAGPLTIPADNQRVGISMSIAQPFGFNEGVSVAIDGFRVIGLNDGSAFVHLTLLAHGDLPTKAFVFTVDNGTVNLGIVQYFMPEEYLAAGLNEFVSQYAREHGALRR